MRTDPTDNGGLFVRRRPGTAPVRYRRPPQRGGDKRRRADAVLAAAIAVLMGVVNLAFFGPLPLAWLWIGSQVDYASGSTFGGIVVAFFGLLGTLMVGLVALRRLDHVWVVVRRAAGHDQRKGIIGPMFGICAALAAIGFAIWLLLFAGLGPTLAPGG